MDIQKEWWNMCIVEISDRVDNNWESLNGETIDKMDGWMEEADNIPA
jgi:hypothetical protein